MLRSHRSVVGDRCNERFAGALGGGKGCVQRAVTHAALRPFRREVSRVRLRSTAYLRELRTEGIRYSAMVVPSHVYIREKREVQ